MSDTCDCCGPADGGSTTERTDVEGPGEDSVDGRWLTERPVTDAALPSDVAGEMSRFLGRDVGTLGEFVAGIRAEVGGAVGVEDLCHADGETPHRAEMDDETYHFQCFYDAVALALLAGQRVDLRTESPGGDVVEAQASPDGEITTEPADVVVSFGVDTDLAYDEAPAHADVYAAVCPTVKAFLDRERYERWAAVTDAPTVGMVLADAVPVAEGLAE